MAPGKRWNLKAGARDSLADALGGEEEEPVPTTISVNQAFAKRFQHNKERDDLQKLKNKYQGDSDGSGSDDSSSEDEDEDGAQIDADFAMALSRIASKDPAIYKKDTRLFPDEDSDAEGDEGSGGGGDGKKAKKAKPQYLRDVLAKQLLEDGAEGVDEEGQDHARRRQSMAPSYHEEQEELRAAFKSAVGSDDDSEDSDGEVFTKKVRSAVEEAREAKLDAEVAAARAQSDAEADSAKVLEKYFSQVEATNANEAFLRDYILNKGWIDKDEGGAAAAGGDYGDGEAGMDIDADADEDYLDDQDAFEAQYNFRFEEPGADKLTSHPRQLEATVRKEDSKRAREREAKKQRREAEKAAKAEELKRLKALKRQELDKKIKLIAEIAGTAQLRLGADEMDEDYDPEKHEEQMSHMFGEEYYAEAEEGADVEKPEFGDLEEELAQFVPGSGFQEATKRAKRSKGKRPAADSDDDDDESEEEASEGDDDAGEGGEEATGARQRLGKRAAKRMRQEVQAHLEEYYKLDYEDLVGGMPTRFRYKTVTPKKFGCSTADVLSATDKELNQIVSLKRIAAYRDDRNDRKYFAPKIQDIAAMEEKKREKHRRDKEQKKAAKAATSTSATEDTQEEGKAARLLSYAVPKVGKVRSVTQMPAGKKKKSKR